MNLCIAGAAKIVLAGVSAFTLQWRHSVEHSRWQEDWTATPAGLQIVAARIESLGAGMEPGPDATFDGHWWRWIPRVPPMSTLTLRHSDAVPEGWTLCANGACRAIADAREKADSVTLSACADEGPPPR